MLTAEGLKKLFPIEIASGVIKGTGFTEYENSEFKVLKARKKPFEIIVFTKKPGEKYFWELNSIEIVLLHYINLLPDGGN